MISKSELKYYSSLLHKKIRKTERKFLVEGKKSVLEGLESDFKCEAVFASIKFASVEEKTIEKLEKKNINVVLLKELDFKRVSDTSTPQGITAVFKMKNNRPDFSTLTEPLTVYLENISDPGNLGTIIRTCDWFGLQNIFFSEKCAEVFSPKVLRSSMGSVFHLNIFENIALQQINKLKNIGYEFLCSDLQGENFLQTKKRSKILLFFSNESEGPSKELLSISDKKITIKGVGKAESLNVASSAAIIISHFSK